MKGWLGLLGLAVGCAPDTETRPAEATSIEASCAGAQSSTGEVAQPITRMQAVGDSILAWNKEENASIPDVVGELLNVPMRNHAVGGATLTGTDGIGSLYLPDGETHVLVNGGGNDFSAECSQAMLDRLITADLASGLLVDLVDDISANGAQAIIVGYYLPSDRETGCELFAPLLERARQLGETRTDTAYVCTLETITPDMPEQYADPVHPSVDGSRAVGTLLAEFLQPSR